MNIEIKPDYLDGRIDAIPSKSHAHRALICASLSDTAAEIICPAESDDIAATISCLNALGAVIEQKPGGYAVQPVKRQSIQRDIPVLQCKESGSTFRFLLPVAGALGCGASFIPEGRLPERPLSPLYEELLSHGCKLSRQGQVPFEIAGQLTPGRYTLDGGVSSQFISGLLFALPLLGGDSELNLTGEIESLPYIELTIDVLRQFGITLSFDGSVFAIPGRQVYKSPGTVTIEGDWSNAAFWLAAGAIGSGTVICGNLNMQSAQGDREICDLLDKFGAWVTIRGDEVTVSKGTGGLKGIEIDAKNIPDLVPVLAVVGAFAEGITKIRNAGRLRIKESDRLSAVTEMLSTLGADITQTDDGLIIHGIAKSSRFKFFDKRFYLDGGTVSSCGDHRIAMAAAVAATVCKAPVTIEGAEAVNKSYPGFFEDMRSLT